VFNLTGWGALYSFACCEKHSIKKMQDESYIAIEHFDPFLLILVLPSCDKRARAQNKRTGKIKTHSIHIHCSSDTLHSCKLGLTFSLGQQNHPTNATVTYSSFATSPTVI
jgi:hypothetical protein